MNNIYGKNVFVTGASSGIGKACAEMFAKVGCHVIGVSRNCKEEILEYENGGILKKQKMDVTDEELVKKIINEIEQIDIAILCAGMGVAGAAEELPMEMAVKQMDVNYFGVLRLGNLILPKMREQKKGLFIVIGSIAGRVPIPMQSHYSSGKYALEAYVEAVRMEMKRFGVRATILEPGDTKTEFTGSRQCFENLDSPYNEICKASVAKMAKDEQNGRSPDSVAKVALRMAGRKNPPVRVAIGIEYKILMFLLRFFPDRLAEWVLAKMYLPK